LAEQYWQDLPWYRYWNRSFRYLTLIYIDVRRHFVLIRRY
jgi:hypothetical protein